MIAAEDTALVLLAAGKSSRFGTGNKLEAEFLGKPVGLHVVTALESIRFQSRFVVVDGCALDFRGYHVIRNDGSEPGMAASVKLGVAAARDAGAKAVLIALADMPRVTAAHIYRLLDTADSADAVVASSDGVRPRPPALFGAGQFDFLLSLTGDAGARDLVSGGKHVVTAPAELIDIDTPEDLEKLRALVHAPEALTRPHATRID
ncbi:nucleotidyltransferase family protein [Sphingomonas donggukensis]|uniref:Nucleotidyltransferase family protein n=1 Tax=Sphingomonas donggukensis TaxID=2949093 RepID=A0ABY4TZC3_9SPHN|nr:nucleotidyltransferase family protein [Sphingomonas donggukensis]URW75673.1 nucleotidyltransferase family protein [Sphingomonas donggukensis]